MMPATIRPLALKIASSATNTNPAWIAFWDCTATIFATWPMIMRPAVAAQAYWTQSDQNAGVRIISCQVRSTARDGAPFAAAFTGAAGLSGFVTSCAKAVAVTRNAIPRMRNAPATPYAAMRCFESGAMYTGARPKPPTTMPVMSPFFSGGNHFNAAGVVAE